MNKVRLGSLISTLTDYHANGSYQVLKKNVTLQDEEDHALMIRTKNFEQNDFRIANKYINKHAYNFLAKSKVFAGDLIMNKIANAGSIYLMPDLDRPVSLAMNLFLIRPDEKKVNPKYIYLFLKINETYVKSFAQGSVTKTITKEAVRNLEISVPHREEQNAIVNVFELISSKIELNQKMNQTLEEIAKAIFKSWFVDFDPVRAKAEGRPTGLPPEISDLFPDELVDSEIGEIPKGWEVAIVSDFGKVVCGKTPSTKDPDNFEGEFPFITIPDMRGNLINLSTERSVSEKGATVLKGKMLPAGSICISCIATPGLVSITSCDSFTNQQINSIVPADEVDKEYLLFSMMTFGDLISSAGSGGSVFANLSTGKFKELPILRANEKLRSAFSRVIRPILQRIELSQKEIYTLSELRDTLLPKLISGELRIPDAEKFLKEAGI